VYKCRAHSEQTNGAGHRTPGEARKQDAVSMSTRGRDILLSEQGGGCGEHYPQRALQFFFFPGS
jgi:hypothetical protein